MNINERLEAMPVDCSRGAPMGRRTIAENPEALVYLQKVEFIDGDYDRGGAYWGGGTPLFCAMSEAGDFVEFVRADTLETALVKIGALYPGLKFATAENNLDCFVTACLEAALWSSLDDDGEPLDCGRTISDIAPETVEEMREDCREFLKLAEPLIGGRYEDAGRDFWFTRNGHGCGFWEESDWPLHGEKLTELATQWGETNLYVGDDGRVY